MHEKEIFYAHCTLAERLITITSTFIILHMTKTSSYNCLMAAVTSGGIQSVYLFFIIISYIPAMERQVKSSLVRMFGEFNLLPSNMIRATLQPWSQINTHFHIPCRFSCAWCQIHGFPLNWCKRLVKDAENVFKGKKIILAERGFDPRTCGLWAQHASTAPLCLRLISK